jgi:putative PIG3 family NAD(P)H quinone oxidoreductase
MRAAVISHPGGPEVLAVRDVETPGMGADDVLVRVRAAGLNRADILQRRGGYAPPVGAPAQIPGLEYAGEVVQAGERVETLAPGDRVFGITGGGAHAELIAVPAVTAARIPGALAWEHAGAIPEAFITAHDALITQAGLSRGDRVLIHAVGSGVGLAALQVARAVGAVPYGTSRTPDKIERAREYGLEGGVAIAEPADVVPHAAEWAPDGFDVVLDLVGGACTPVSVSVLALRGRLLLVGLVGGSTAAFDLRRILSRRIAIIGTVLRSRSVAEKAAATEAFVRDLAAGFESNTLRAVIDSVFPLDAIADAHRRMESNTTFGKVVIVP